MLDQSAYCGNLSLSHGLLLEAIRSLEYVCGSHQTLMRDSKRAPITRKSFNRDVSVINSNLRRTLDRLTLLYFLLFDAQYKDRTGPLSLNSSLLSYLRLELVIPNQSKAGYSVLAQESQNSVIEKKLPIEESAKFFGHGSVASRNIRPSEQCDTIDSYIPAAGLAGELNQFRKALELRFDTRSNTGIPRDIILSLDSLEKLFHITRPFTADSIWNVDHQVNRNEIFQASDEGVAYRQRCICNSSDGLKNHVNDVYCPKNIQDEAKSTGTHDKPSDDKKEDKIEKSKRDPSEKMKSQETFAKVQDLLGRENVKRHFNDVKSIIESKFRAKDPWVGIHFGLILMGPSNTGKNSIARRYGRYLIQCNICNDNFIEIKAGDMLKDTSLRSNLKTLKGGGVFFIDDAHLLVSFRKKETLALNHLLKKIEKRQGKLIVVLSGRESEMKSLIERAPAAKVFPYFLNVNQYKDDDILSILSEGMKNWFGVKAEVEDGWEGLYMRIISRRLAKAENAKGKEANITHAVEKLISQIWKRQCERLEREPQENEGALQNDKKLEGQENINGIATTSKISSKTSKTETAPKGSEHRAPAASDTDPLFNDSHIIELSSNKNLSSERESETQPKPRGTPASYATDTKKSSKQDVIDELSEIGTSTDAGEVPEAQTAKEHNFLSNNTCGHTTGQPGAIKNCRFTKDDMLGPCPGEVLLESESWKQLQELTGLESVKEALRRLSELAKTNYQRELQEKPPLGFTFNRLFLGPPGSGKTLVARLYGKILAELGVLSKGELIMRNASDLIGKYIGDSEANTKDALNEGTGNVLLIDEAYILYNNDGCSNTTDVFRQGIIDTLVGGIQNVPSEDRCVILVGYEDKMKEMLLRSNPGLSRRFPLEEAFIFKEFTLDELESILRFKLKSYQLEATEDAIITARSILNKASMRMNFGNGGDVENLITKAKSNYLSRIIECVSAERPDIILEPQDFDVEHDRGSNATENLRKLFSNVVGCEVIVERFKEYQIVCQAMQAKRMDPRAFIPTNFVFKGPPGTGKTTTARKVAQVYYDMGFLSEPAVIECSVTDLIGSYVGQTGPKTVQTLERALGKVLFIDEAYRLSQGGSSGFALEAVSELVDCLTKPKFQGKIVVILAGYEREMNLLLDMNPGIASRFSEEFNFTALSPKECLHVLGAKLKEVGIAFPVISRSQTSEYHNLERFMRILANSKNWGNARDTETLAKAITRKVFSTMENADDQLVCTAELAATLMKELVEQRKAREDDSVISYFN